MTEPGIDFTRVFDASIERVWREWTEPACFADWFGGAAATVPIESVSMDVRAGGGWKLTMVVGGRSIDWHGQYLEVDAPARLAFTVSDQAPEVGYDTVIVDLRSLDDGRTEMRFQQRGGGLTPEQYKAAGAGWGKFFDHIDERLASG
ncbi:MAG TPA: SRPBCC domain-containing protein [Solirubrobacteraceae bacterium]|nr:SRPBCC domain-containing protein [Solirubrobacteraceae bacterium]